MLNNMNTKEKTIIFCANIAHAMMIRDLVNQLSVNPPNDYCVSVTAADGEIGEQQLRYFQDTERLTPTILTTSSKLSTGVDASNIRNIVLMRLVKSMVEFKQIIGRGTRLNQDKYYFTIIDFVGASENFSDLIGMESHLHQLLLMKTILPRLLSMMSLMMVTQKQMNTPLHVINQL